MDIVFTDPAKINNQTEINNTVSNKKSKISIYKKIHDFILFSRKDKKNSDTLEEVEYSQNQNLQNFTENEITILDKIKQTIKEENYYLNKHA